MPNQFNFSDQNWTFDKKTSGENIWNWSDGNGVSMQLQCIGPDKELSNFLSDEAALRKYFRDNLSSQGIGVVECASIVISGVPSAKVIGKIIIPGEPAQYIASLSIPLKDRSYVLSLYAREEGITGLRDTTVLTNYLSENDEEDLLDEDGTISGWACDPYFPEYEGPSLRNQADSEQYDDMFPEHPLSKVRTRINEVCPTISILEVYGAQTKPWWKFWS